MFVDIRIRRSVRAAGFTGPAFEKLVGNGRHHWMKSLGNRFIETRIGPDIQIADPRRPTIFLTRSGIGPASASASVFLRANGPGVRARSPAIERPWQGWS